MPAIRTHEICAEGLSAHLVKKVALAFGLNEGTVQAWRRPKESDLEPTGTGKRNPLDQAERLICIVHQSNPGNARQAANYFLELVDELDREAGCIADADEASESATIVTRLRELIKESSDVAMALVGSGFEEHTLRQALREIAEERSALERLSGAVEMRLKTMKSARGDEAQMKEVVGK